MKEAMRKKLWIGIGFVLMLVALPMTAQAHVKWFTDFSFADEPLSLGEALTPTFLALAALSFVVIGALVFVDRQIAEFSLYKQIDNWLSSRKEYSTLILRIGTGVVLLLSWQADALLMPELEIPQAWIGWLQFIIALLLIFPVTVPLAGAGLIALYIIGIFEFGAFHMLDYLLYMGAGYYLIVAQNDNPAIRGTGLPALYATIGFSLCWVALEKVFYPQWGIYILEQNPQLTLGFPVDFFLLAAAFIEFALGYLLIIGLLERPLALVITLVFFTTTLVFGKVEVIGHTLIHASLLVFLLEGPGDVYPEPIAIHNKLNWRVAFASVNFVLLLVVMTLPYSWGAMQRYEENVDVAALQTIREPFDSVFEGGLVEINSAANIIPPEVSEE
jgi:uncharacterized membrane protein YphA (DoxX/SURF4 family)